MKNIKVSKTFSFLIITTVFVIFLLPNLYSRVVLYNADSNYDAMFERQAEHDRALLGSVKKLGPIDAGLKKCIESALYEYKGIPLNMADVSHVFQVKKLSCYRHGIKSIDGIEQLQELEYLDLSSNLVTDVTPLLNLKSLKGLNLSELKLTDFKLLLGFDNLISIKLPNVKNVPCADVVDLVESTQYEFRGLDYAKSSCLKDTVPAS